MPSGRFSITCGVVVDVHVSTVVPSFVIVSSAPGSSSEVTASFLEIVTVFGTGASYMMTVLFVQVSVTLPPSIVKSMLSAFW